MDDTLPDADYLDGVRDAVAAIDPVLEPPEDGISVVAVSLEPTLDGSWPELEVTWGLSLPDTPELEDVSREGTFRLPFGRSWLELSFYPQPVDYAELVRRHLEREAYSALRAHFRPDHLVQLPPRRDVDDLWAEFLAELAETGRAVREVAPGRIEVLWTDDDGEPRLRIFLITRQEWADLRNRGFGEYGLGELIGDPDEDVTFFRYAGNGFSRSIREELPEVRGTAVLRKIAAIRARDPDARLYWTAERSGNSRGRGDSD